MSTTNPPNYLTDPAASGKGGNTPSFENPMLDPLAKILVPEPLLRVGGRYRMGVLSAWLVVSLGSAALLMNVAKLDIPFLQGFWHPASPATEIMFVLIGLGLLSLINGVFFRDSCIEAALAGVATALYGVWLTTDSVRHTGSDGFWWTTIDSSIIPGINFVLIGGVLALAAVKPHLRHTLGWGAFAVIGLGILHFQTGLLESGTKWSPLGWGVSLGFFGVGFSIIASTGLNPAPFKILAGESAKARLVRRILPLNIGFMFMAVVFVVAGGGYLPREEIWFQVTWIGLAMSLGGVVAFENVRRAGEAIDREKRELLASRSEPVLTTHEIADRERKRIGEQLHDSVCQLLTGIGLLSNGLEQKLAVRGAAELPLAVNIRKLAQQATKEASQISRSLYTGGLDFRSLCNSLVDLGEDVQQKYGVDCQFVEQGDFPEIDSRWGTKIFRIAQEAVHNAIKHGPTSGIMVTLSCTGKDIILEIANDGRIFATDKNSDGIGLRIMEQRACSMGGTLDVKPAKTGTVVECRIPLFQGEEHIYDDGASKHSY